MLQSPENTALDYLRPYRLQGLAPIDIMRLPEASYQGCHIEIRGKTLFLTHEGETHMLSLKKLIITLDKECGLFGRSFPATPRELAKMLIHTSVEQHEDITHLAYSHQGMGWYGYDVSIGGYIRLPGKNGKPGKAQWIDCWHIVVQEFDGEACNQVFDLREIYQEIEREIKQGFTIVQSTLF